MERSEVVFESARAAVPDVEAVVHFRDTFLRPIAALPLTEEDEEAVQAELSQAPVPVRLGSLFVSAPRSSGSKHVFHIAVSGPNEASPAGETSADVPTSPTDGLRSLAEAFAGAVAEARRYRRGSLAVPLWLPPETSEVPRSLAAEAVANALAAALRREPDPPLERIVLLGGEDRKALALVEQAFASNVDAAEWLSLANAPPEPAPTASGAPEGTAAAESVLVGCAVAGGTGGGIPVALGSIACSMLGPAAVAVANLVSAAADKHLNTRGREAAPSSVRSDGSEVAALKAALEDAERKQRDDASLLDKLRRKVANLREEVRTKNDELVVLRTASRADTDPAAQFSLPVAYAVTMADRDIDPLSCAKNLCTAIGILLRYLGAVALAEYQASGFFDGRLDSFLKEAFRRPATDGQWREVSVEVASSYAGRAPKFLPELPGLWFQGPAQWTPLRKNLHTLVRLRNEFAHGTQPVEDGGVTHWLSKAQPRWRAALNHARPLLRYRLFLLVSHLDVGSADPGATRYVVRWLVGEQFIPRAEIVEWRPRLKTGTLYLTDPGASRFLPLSPFLDYLPCPVSNTREACLLDQYNESEITLETLRFPYPFTQPAPESFLSSAAA